MMANPAARPDSLSQSRDSVTPLATSGSCAISGDSEVAVRLDQFSRMCAKSYRNLAKQQAAALTLWLASAILHKV
jgi:hypothetical protein